MGFFDSLFGPTESQTPAELGPNAIKQQGLYALQGINLGNVPTSQLNVKGISTTQPYTGSTNNQTSVNTNTSGGGDSSGDGGGDPYASLKADIYSAWDAYTSSLGNTANQFLP